MKFFPTKERLTTIDIVWLGLFPLAFLAGVMVGVLHNFQSVLTSIGVLGLILTVVAFIKNGNEL